MCLGIPGKIIAISDVNQHLGIADVSGIQRAVNLSCVTNDISDMNDLIGQWVLVHVGFAMSVINEADAQSTLAVLTELGELQDELMAMQEGES